MTGSFAGRCQLESTLTGRSRTYVSTMKHLKRPCTTNPRVCILLARWLNNLLLPKNSNRPAFGWFPDAIPWPQSPVPLLLKSVIASTREGATSQPANTDILAALARDHTYMPTVHTAAWAEATHPSTCHRGSPSWVNTFHSPQWFKNSCCCCSCGFVDILPRYVWYTA